MTSWFFDPVLKSVFLWKTLSMMSVGDDLNNRELLTNTIDIGVISIYTYAFSVILYVNILLFQSTRIYEFLFISFGT